MNKLKISAVQLTKNVEELEASRHLSATELQKLLLLRAKKSGGKN